MRDGWVGYAVAAVAVVVATGLLLHRRAVPLIAAGQCLAVLVLLTALVHRRRRARACCPGRPPSAGSAS